MDYVSIITLAAKKAGVSAVLLLAVCGQESGLKDVNNENDKGSPSIGICQMKEKTAALLNFKGTRKELQKPSVNAYYAGLYLKKQLDRYNGDGCKAVSAFNSGSYFESKVAKGKPRNLRYVNKVKSLITERNTAMMLECGVFAERN